VKSSLLLLSGRNVSAGAETNVAADAMLAPGRKQISRQMQCECQGGKQISRQKQCERQGGKQISRQKQCERQGGNEYRGRSNVSARAETNIAAEAM
jgi:hypothetical protein